MTYNNKIRNNFQLTIKLQKKVIHIDKIFGCYQKNDGIKKATYCVCCLIVVIGINFINSLRFLSYCVISSSKLM